MQIRYITERQRALCTRSKLYEKIVGLLRGEAKPQAGAPGPSATGWESSGSPQGPSTVTAVDPSLRTG